MSHLAVTQKNPDDSKEPVAMKPHEFYNLHVRKEGEKVLDEKEYKEFIKREKDRANAKTGTKE